MNTRLQHGTYNNLRTTSRFMMDQGSLQEKSARRESVDAGCLESWN